MTKCKKETSAQRVSKYIEEVISYIEKRESRKLKDHEREDIAEFVAMNFTDMIGEYK